MGKRTIPATEAKTIYDCDGGCERKDIGRAEIEIEARVNDRDYTGNVVYAHDVVLCQRCASDFRKWIIERGGNP